MEGEMDKFRQIGGMGITPESLKIRVLLDKRYNPAKPILFGKRYTLWQNHGQAFLLYPKACSYYGRFTLNVVN